MSQLVKKYEAEEEVIQRVRRKILEEFEKMKVVIEDAEISVYTVLVDDDVVRLVLIALDEAKQPLSWRDLKKIFSGIVGEDRLRKILSSLKARNIIAELTHTRYSLPQYVPVEEIPKIKNPGIIPVIERIHGKRLQSYEEVQ
ncbi:hypothetical protein apy_13850 [Aeropyrum pernix]|uniref:Uncharacterized protein n=1 Tax=Aeropyrum pernix TaxID=56636 RepID=A0A401HBA8_AERPX|nr:hypothetical protein [Aeropyrum pernix]GBF09660.1 hypothetical protein apy_13850 [Aeropyrum pernix]